MDPPFPRLPAPYAEGANASGQEQDAWEAAINAFVTNVVLYKLSSETTAAQLFALFDAPEHQPTLFYYACADLLSATREYSDAGEHIALIAALFELLKEEGLRRDDADGFGAFGNAVVFPTLRRLVSDIPAPPGRYKLDTATYILVPDPEYVEADSFLCDLAQYAREREGLLRLWSLIARLEADRILGDPGSMSLLFHQGPVLLLALADPVQRGVWETLWAAVLRCEEDMTYGTWGAGSEWLGPFKDAARQIVRDERAPMESRARFALILEALEKKR
ncbi:hypothetical protein FA95DRAFT_1599853 [Auriscalpium vulgare]|uniref:Uncharacterized protein n=1 Tax=Auriscalpium vulgare TaxID=40419 RepID=A0ACB8R5H2_9AGAM|nr:hypothetical protein FA95DRAFT_1599853 [Auriscalpium vulgare]